MSGSRLTPVLPQRLTAADVDDALARLDPARVAAVVFASNALRHPDGAMSLAYSRHGDAVGRYLAAGGAVVVLHQYVVGDLGGHLGAYQPVLTERRPAPCVRIDPVPGPVTRHPHVVGTDVESHAAPGGQLRERVYWRALDMDLMPNFVPVLVTASGDTVAARTRPDLAGTVVATTLPLDWHRARVLTENVLHHALVPRARLAVWGDTPSPSEASAVRSLGEHHGALSLGVPPDGDLPVAPHSVQVHYLTGPALSARPDLAAHVREEHRGVVITAAPTDRPAASAAFRLEVARVDRAALERAAVAIAERVADFTAPDLYPRRNILEFVRLADDPGAHLHPDVAHALRSAATRLRVLPLEFDGMTVSTALASLQLSLLGLADATSAHALRLVRDYTRTGQEPRDEGCYAAALLATAGDGTELDAALDATAALLPRMNDVEVARVAEWLHVTHARGTLATADPGRIASLAAALAGHVRTRPDALDRLSCEALANITLGLAALAGVTGDGDVVTTLLLCATRLRGELDAADPHQNLPEHLRAVTALASASAHVPAPLTNVADALRAPGDHAGATADDAAVARLTRLAEDQRQEIQDLADRLAGQRVAAALGRGATSLVVLAVAAGVLLGAGRYLAAHESLLQFGLVVLLLVLAVTGTVLRALARRGLASRRFATVADRVWQLADRVR